jgi:3D (Asp-Asp-Asp) domain-containing protein
MERPINQGRIREAMLRLGFSLVALLAAGGHLARADTVTAYCHCRKCTPGCKITANGMHPVEGVTIAGPRWVPLGTRVKVSGLGSFVVQDRLARSQEGRWDIYMASHQRAKGFGKKELRVTLLSTPRL